MKLRLVRRSFTDRATEGELFVDGELACYTLEDVVRAPGVKVYGETAIPFGRFQLALHASPKFRRTLPVLLGVPHFSSVLMHAGNRVADSSGCILVGFDPTARDDAWIADSRLAETALVATLKTALASGPAWLEVVGPTLRKGAGGTAQDVGAVRVLQQWLRMDPHHQTGYFGERTERAVRELQGDYALGVDGVCGPRTWCALGKGA